MSTGRWLLLIVLAGAILRLVPIWFGLPYLGARPDEEVATGIAARVAAGDLNPRFFHWPSLTFYVFAGLFRAAGAIRRLAGSDGGLSAAEQLLVARACVALAGTATLVVLFDLGRRVAGPSTGLLAAALLAVAMLHVRDSHFAMTDVLMTLLVTAALALLVRAVDQGEPVRAWRRFAAAGVVAGLAVSTKYNAAAIGASMGAAQLLVWSPDWRSVASPRTWLPSIAFAVACVAGFLVGTPYALLDFGRFASHLYFDFTHLAEGHGLNIDLGRGWSSHLTRSLPYGVGPPAFAAGILGIPLLFRHHLRAGLVVASFAAALYAAVGTGYSVFFRYVLPLVPVLCLTAALAVRHAAAWVAARGLASRLVALASFACVTLVTGLVNSVWFDVLLARTDTRVIASRWLAERVRPGEALHDAGDAYASLDLTAVDVDRLPFDPATGRFGTAEGRKPDWLVLPESPLFTYARPPTALRNLAWREYVLVKTVRATRSRSRAAVYDLQDAFFMPLWGFWTVERPGPTVRIYWRRGAE